MKCGARRAGSGAVSPVVLGFFLHREGVFESDGKTQDVRTCLVSQDFVRILGVYVQVHVVGSPRSVRHRQQ